LGLLAGIPVAVALLLVMYRLADGEWMWQGHLRSKCRCGILYAPTEQCPGARMGRAATIEPWIAEQREKQP